MNVQAEKVAQKAASGFNLSLLLKKSNSLVTYLLLLWILDLIRQGVCPSPFNGVIELEKNGKIFRFLMWEFYPCIYMLYWVLVFGFYLIKNWSNKIAQSHVIVALYFIGTVVVLISNFMLFFFDYEFFSNNIQLVERQKTESGAYLSKCDILGGSLSADLTATRKEIFLAPEIKWVYDQKKYKDTACTIPF